MAETPPELQAEIQKLERKHAENPEGRYFVPLANAYRKAGQLGRAESLLRDGLHRHPEYLSAHIVLGRCLADGGAAREATEEFRFVLSLDPQNLIALRSLGDLSLGQGHMDEAARWYDELLRADPMNEDARRALDSLRAREADVEAAAPSVVSEAEPDAVSVELPVLQASDDDLVLADPMGWASEAPEPGAGGPDRLAELDLYGGYEDTDDAAGDLPAFDQGPELVTETIAELYARQGLYQRAADVYRELIRRRGGDAGLQRRLAEVERLSAGDPGPAGPDPDPLPWTAEVVSAPAEDPADDDSGEFWLPELADDPDLDRATLAEEEAAITGELAEPVTPVAVEASAPRTIAHFLAGLAAWRPRDAGTVPASLAAPEQGEEAAPLDGTVTAGDDLVPTVEVNRPLPEPGIVDAEAVEPIGAGPDASGSADGDLYTGRAERDVTPEPTLGAPQPPEQAPAARSRGPLDDDDDDLESFQAWLRSLKR